MSEFGKWIKTAEAIPHDEEVVAFWTNYPRRILLFGEFHANDDGGEFINYLDADHYNGPIRFRTRSGWVDYWCHFNDPATEQTKEEKD
jgi:hypothetical protein